MSKEMIFSGYCRVLDQSRMVMTEWEDRDLLDADCCYGACVHQNTCEIAKKISALLRKPRNRHNTPPRLSRTATPAIHLQKRLPHSEL